MATVNTTQKHEYSAECGCGSCKLRRISHPHLYDISSDELERATEVLIETAGTMVATAWFQVMLRNRLKLPDDVAEARFIGMVKMADATLELPHRFVDTCKEEAVKMMYDAAATGLIDRKYARIGPRDNIYLDSGG